MNAWPTHTQPPAACAACAPEPVLAPPAATAVAATACSPGRAHTWYAQCTGRPAASRAACHSRSHDTTLAHTAGSWLLAPSAAAGSWAQGCSEGAVQAASAPPCAVIPCRPAPPGPVRGPAVAAPAPPEPVEAAAHTSSMSAACWPEGCGSVTVAAAATGAAAVDACGSWWPLPAVLLDPPPSPPSCCCCCCCWYCCCCW
mmetsp:Transcript_9059/g.22405  ORF Transcript_9059/g.22405 Transcript_9059/m.22405 type:complete len:200 (+) Transcript_9059:684-1283(+)